MTVTRTRISLRVSPGARRSEVVGRYADGWKVRVAAPPVDGRANGVLERYLSDVLAVPAACVRVVSGAGARHKMIEVEGRDAGQADALLAAAAQNQEVVA